MTTGEKGTQLCSNSGPITLYCGVLATQAIDPGHGPLSSITLVYWFRAQMQFLMPLSPFKVKIHFFMECQRDHDITPPFSYLFT